MGPKNEYRNTALDGLRGIAAGSVLLFHLWLYATPDAPGGSLTTAADWVWSSGRLGLNLFFVLSGFLLYRAWLGAALGDGRPPNLRRFLRTRAARILPAYHLALLGSIALLWGLGSVPGVRLPSAGELPLFFVFGENFSSHSLLTLNPPMWTLAVEISFYLALPLIGLVALRIGPRPRGQAALLMALLGVGVAWNAAVPSVGPLSKVLPALLPFFALGMLAALWTRERTLSAGAARWLLAAGLLAVAGNVALHALDLRLSAASHNLPAGVGFAAIVAAAGVGEGLNVLRLRPLVALGTVSYGVYLWHVPMLWWLRGEGLLPLHPVLALPVVLVPTLLLATASWRFVERPMIELARSRRPRRTAVRRPERDAPAVAAGASQRFVAAGVSQSAP
jgi:peptidoglycan/LPS O-acetylase OafA/YrhL